VPSVSRSAVVYKIATVALHAYKSKKGRKLGIQDFLVLNAVVKKPPQTLGRLNEVLVGRWQRLKPMEKLAGMLLAHLEGILNYCRTKVPMGVVEAVNGIIKALMVAAVVIET
jgi:hypothetical protein